MTEPAVITPKAAEIILRHLPARRIRVAFLDSPLYPEIFAALLALEECAAREDASGGMEIATPAGRRDDECMDVKTAARRTGRAERTIRAAIERGDLKAHKSGGWCIHSLDLATWAFNRDRRERRTKERTVA